MSYAHALFEITQAQDLWHVLPEQLDRLTQAVLPAAPLHQYLAQPDITTTQKVERVTGLLADVCHPVLLKLVQDLVQHGRLHTIGHIQQQYQTMVDRARLVLPAEVSTTVPMTDQQQHRLVETLKHMTGMHDIRLTTHVVPELLGGVVLKIQDLIVDGSTIGKLSQLRKQWC
jgi:F-type H+-transporting ATPase subunit delta